MGEFKAHRLCKLCNGGSYDEMVSESHDPILLCDCCVAVGAHLSCLDKAGASITSNDLQNPAFQWFCCEACQQVSSSLVAATNIRRPLDKNGIYTTELVRYSTKFRTSQNIVGTVVGMFHSAFGPSLYSDGSDLIQLVCQGANHDIPDADEEEDQPPDCSNFLIFVLRKGGNIVSGAAIRVHGTKVAEMPYAVTREGYRREGHCAMMMAALEELLRELKVEYLATPAVEATVAMWKNHFGFTEAGEEDGEHLEERIVVPGDTCILIKKIPAIAPPTAKAAAATKKRVRFSLDEEEEEEDDLHRSTRRTKSGKKSISLRNSMSSTASDSDYDVNMSDVEAEDREARRGQDLDEEEEEECCGCSKFSAHQPKSLQEYEETGDMLCEKCFGVVAGTGSGGVVHADGRMCYHCKATDATKYHKHAESGGWECATCKRYRTTHNGELRPAKLFARRKPTPIIRPAAVATDTAVNAVVSGPVITPEIMQRAVNSTTPSRTPQFSYCQHAEALIRGYTSRDTANDLSTMLESQLNVGSITVGLANACIAVVKGGIAAHDESVDTLRQKFIEDQAEKEVLAAAVEEQWKRAEAAEAEAAAMATKIAEMEQQLLEMHNVQEEMLVRQKEAEDAQAALAALPAEAVVTDPKTGLDQLIHDLGGDYFSPDADENILPDLDLALVLAPNNDNNASKLEAENKSPKLAKSPLSSNNPTAEVSVEKRKDGDNPLQESIPKNAAAPATLNLFALFQGFAGDDSGETSACDDDNKDARSIVAAAPAAAESEKEEAAAPSGSDLLIQSPPNDSQQPSNE